MNKAKHKTTMITCPGCKAWQVCRVNEGTITSDLFTIHQAADGQMKAICNTCGRSHVPLLRITPAKPTRQHSTTIKTTGKPPLPPGPIKPTQRKLSVNDLYQFNDIKTINKRAKYYLVGPDAGSFTQGAFNMPLSWWLDIIEKEKQHRFRHTPNMMILRMMVISTEPPEHQ